MDSFQFPHGIACSVARCPYIKNFENTHISPSLTSIFSSMDLSNATALANQAASKAQKFIPVENGYPETWSPSDIETNPREDKVTYLACPGSHKCPDCQTRVEHIGTLVVAVDGACSGNGIPGGAAKAGIGIYMGRDSPYNVKKALPQFHAGQQSTNQKAELFAALTALKYVAKLGKIHKRFRHLSMVVIKTDSSYVFHGMTEWMGKWFKNGFKTDKGTVVVNADIFQALGEAVDQLQGTVGCKVYFWLVKREYNVDADRLAKEGVREGFA